MEAQPCTYYSSAHDSQSLAASFAVSARGSHVSTRTYFVSRKADGSTRLHIKRRSTYAKSDQANFATAITTF